MTDDVIRVFLPRHEGDAENHPIAEITRTQAHEIVAAAIRALEADEIAQVRWSDVLAARILGGEIEGEGALAHALIALLVIDGGGLGRVTLDTMRFIYARIEKGGALHMAAVDSPDECDEARRRLFWVPQTRMAA